MKKLFLLSIFTTIFVSCDKYLDIQPKNLVIPQSVEDYDLLLNGIHTTSNEEVLALTGDDYNIPTYYASSDITNPDNQQFQLFSWGNYRFYDPQYTAVAWNEPYSHIYTHNKIINEVLQAEASVGYSQQDKRTIQAEAYYNRALEYFFLVNIFGKAYSTSANIDLSVPIVTTADVTQSGFDRAPLTQAYDFIIADLEKAIKNLPSRSKLHIRPNLGSGYSLLSRVYLYKGDYQKSIEYADKAIAFKGTLQDYVSMNQETIIPAHRSEQYSMRHFGYIGGYPAGLSDNLKQVLSTTDDARYYNFFTPYSGVDYIVYGIQPNMGTSVGEMYITRAECYARLGRKDLAIADLNELRSKRIKNHTPVQESDFQSDKDLIKFCLDERRRETFLTYMRVFDIKRMNLEPDFATPVVKEFKGKTYTAEPNSGKLVVPIPEQVRKFNPSWK